MMIGTNLINIPPETTIIFEFNKDNTTLEEISQYTNMLSELLPNNNLICTIENQIKNITIIRGER